MWDKKSLKILAYLSVFAIAFGYFEASVVVYLRELYYPGGFNVPIDLGFPYIFFKDAPYLQIIPDRILFTEIGREIATLTILVSAAFVCGKTKSERTAYFLWPFAIWDIFYYVFLKLLIGWPDSLGTIDVLFLIPVPWLAPVWVPIMASALMLAASAFILKKRKKD